MANIKAVANGNWSNTATWDGGILPTSADDVFANGFTVTINGTFTVLSIRNTSGTGIVAGGQFIYANGGNLTCTAAQAIFAGIANIPVLEMTLASPNTGTFNGSVLTLNSTSNFTGIRLSNTGTLNLNGNYNLDGANSRVLISVTSTGTLNIVGDVTSTVTGIASNLNAIQMVTNGTINITGNVTGATNTNVASSTILASSGTLNITGNTTANVSPAINLSGAVTYTQIGNVNASTVQPAIYNASAAATISVTGIITAGSGAPAIYAAFALTSGYGSGTFVRVSGNVVNSTNIMAIVAPRVTIDTNTSSWLFQISTGGNRILYAAGVSLGNPAANNVRSGVTYGASNELTGTLAVPSPSNVLSGVPTDNTTGTYSTTPALIATEIFTKLLSSTDFNTSGSFGKLVKDNLDAQVSSRLASSSYVAPNNADISAIKARTDLIPNNPASVDAVGAIVASYNV